MARRRCENMLAIAQRDDEIRMRLVKLSRAYVVVVVVTTVIQMAEDDSIAYLFLYCRKLLCVTAIEAPFYIEYPK